MYIHKDRTPYHNGIFEETTYYYYVRKIAKNYQGNVCLFQCNFYAEKASHVLLYNVLRMAQSETELKACSRGAYTALNACYRNVGDNFIC